MLTVGVICIIGTSIGMFFLNNTSPVYGIVIITAVIGVAVGILNVSNQLTLFAVAPADQVGVSFGLYRTVGYIGAIIAGSAIKHSFKNGATDVGLHSLSLYSLISCATIVLFMLPLYFKSLKLSPSK